MTNEKFIQWLNKTFNKKINMAKLIRSEYGKLSLANELNPVLERLRQKASTFIQVSREKIYEPYWNGINNTFKQIAGLLEAQANRNEHEYATQRPSFIESIKSRISELNQNWSFVISAVVDAKGLLEEKDIKKEHEQVLNDLRKESEKVLNQAKETSAKIINDAKNLSNEIMQQAKRTATEVSIKDAQKQFEYAATKSGNQAKWWGMGSLVSIGFFIIVASIFYNSLPDLHDTLQDCNSYNIISHVVLRLIILGALGAIASFCLSVFRANLHMMQHNYHRQRVANSMEAFVASASTAEQRDIILAQLVETIVSFGSSGLLSKKSDAVFTPKMYVDTVNRAISPPAPHSGA